MSRVASAAVTTDTDAVLSEALSSRRAQQLATMPQPQYPASGTALLEQRLAEARARSERRPPR